ncbi:hypothetical protein DAMA08_046350 [Martiniozyma asiatica (nom. inval.)]|nr:hypothetical protein DAMA08_046350 [Martiniozyma asiatica]
MNVVESNGVRLLLVAETRGQISLLNELAVKESADAIIHTGNFGFFDVDSVERIHESYLRHIVEFSPLLPRDLVQKVAALSKVNGDSVLHLSTQQENLKGLLKGHTLSELPRYISGELKLTVPLYTVYGMCEDSTVINKFRHGVYKVHNLNIIDDAHVHCIDMAGTSVLLAGIGGSLSYHKLFHQGSTQAAPSANSILPVSGDPGNIWITMLQLGQLIESFLKFSEGNSEKFNRAIKIFVTHHSPAREPLLEHLAMFFKMDYTISSSLHFKYTASFNELCVNPSFETFKLKFSESRTKLAKIWLKIQKKYEKLLSQLPTTDLTKYLDLALTVFDKIPVSTSGDDIQPLSLQLSQNIPYTPDLTSKTELNSIIRHLNDLYYVSFQHMWHYNLSDVQYGYSSVNVSKEGRVRWESKNEGFDFKYRIDGGVDHGGNLSFKERQ